MRHSMEVALSTHALVPDLACPCPKAQVYVSRGENPRPVMVRTCAELPGARVGVTDVISDESDMMKWSADAET